VKKYVYFYFLHCVLLIVTYLLAYKYQLIFNYTTRVKTEEERQTGKKDVAE